MVKVIPLGGVGEIGKNCTVVEDQGEILVIDCGLSFPNEEMPGIDIVVPDFTYLIQNSQRVKGVVITHAHEDHIGGLPYLLRALNVPIYASPFTHAMMRPKLEEKVGKKALQLKTFNPGDGFKVGKFEVETLRVTHSIPESCAIAVMTTEGALIFTGDFKLDFTPVDGKLTDLAKLTEISHEGVLCLFSDSTNVDRPGWGPSERAVQPGLRAGVEQAEGRVLLTTFASNVHRMQQFIEVAHQQGRKVGVVGRRMEQSIDICENLGYIRLPKGVRVSLDEVKQLPDHEAAILTTGSQGEPMSALVQMSKGSYGRLQIKEGDTLIYSARTIPGNEGAVWRTINRLYRQGCNVIYDSPTPVHVSGHGYQQELMMMVNLVKPHYIAPVHGEPRHQHLYTRLVKDMGYPDSRVFMMESGCPLVFHGKKAYIDEAVPHGRVLIDNSGLPGVTDEILRDRYNAANEGMVIITVAIDMDDGDVIGEPIVQSKGLHAHDNVLDTVQSIVVDALYRLSKEERMDSNRVQIEIVEVAKRALHKRAQIRPLVIPTIVSV